MVLASVHVSVSSPVSYLPNGLRPHHVPSKISWIFTSDSMNHKTGQRFYLSDTDGWTYCILVPSDKYATQLHVPSIFHRTISVSRLTTPYLSLISPKDKMISAKKLVKLARKWQRMAALGRKRINFPRTSYAENDEGTSKSSVAEKGHFVVYTSDQKRFVMPMSYLNNTIFQELLRMSEEEFGLSSEGPIILPCDSAFFEYVQSLLQRGLSRDLETALLNSIASCGTICSQSVVSLTQEHRPIQSLVYGY